MTSETQAARGNHRTILERRSDRDLVITRTFDAPAHVVYQAWTTSELFKQWWVPKSCGATLRSCEQDVRTGGGYRLEYAHPQAEGTMAFYGKYLDVVPDARLVWTNEESEDAPLTTVTFEDRNGNTLLVLSECYPSKQALDVAIEGMDEAMPETFEQLDALLAVGSRGPSSGAAQRGGF